MCWGGGSFVQWLIQLTRKGTDFVMCKWFQKLKKCFVSF